MSKRVLSSFVVAEWAIAVCLIALFVSSGIHIGRGDGREEFFAMRDVQAQTAAPMGGMDAPKTPAPLSTSLALTVDGKTTTFSVAELKAMPQKSLKVHNEHTKADESYSGVTLSDLLAKAGFAVTTATHRTMLRSYLKAEGTDKYWVLYAVTEVEDSEHEGDVIVATSMDGKGLGADGELKLVSTEDKKPQRWVRNLAAIEMKSAD
jgi:hypothetical protein